MSHRVQIRHAVPNRRLPILAAILVVAVLLALGLSGCKYTDVLTEHVEDPVYGELDPDAEPLYVPDPSASPIEDLVDVSIEDVQDINTQEQRLPHYDPDAPDNGETRKLVYREDTPHEDEAAEGEEESGDEATSEGQGESEGSEEGTGDTLDDADADEEGGTASTGGAGGAEAITDPNGVTQEAKKGTIAACGHYATITQMLGGPGGLVAADESWFAELPEGVFPGELEDVKVGFWGDGTEAGSVNVDALVNEIMPSVVLWDGSQPNLTDDDLAALAEAGIEVQTVPHIGEPYTTDDTIVQAVRAVAAVLVNVEGVGEVAEQARATYEDYRHTVLQTVYDANGGYSYKAGGESAMRLYQDAGDAAFSNPVNTRMITCYVDGWWDGAPSSIYVTQRASVTGAELVLPNDSKDLDSSEGLGTSVASSADAFMLIDYYLQLGGLVNSAYDSPKPTPSGKPYIIMPGRTSSDFGSFSSRSGTDSALWYTSGDSSIASNWREAGTESFPAIIVRTDDIAQRIASNAAGGGVYYMQNPYQVLVVPDGVMGTWAYGTPESFLLAAWALRLRDGGADTVGFGDEATSQFYRYFYRCDDWSSAFDNWNSAYTAQ